MLVIGIIFYPSMRIKITLSTDKSGIIDFNYQHQIQGLIYSFLSSSDPDYSSWLHEQGFVYDKDKRFKLFVFSGITFNAPIKINCSNSSNGSSGLNGLNRLNGFFFEASPINPFTLSFQIASPVHQFIQHLIEGIFKEGQEIKLGRQSLQVHHVETLPDPLGRTGLNRSNSSSSSIGLSGLNGLIALNGLNSLLMKPLESPIFVKKPMPEGERDKYLFPGDENHEELLNQNLIHKYTTLYGKPYKGEPLKFDFRFEQFEHLKRLEPLERLERFDLLERFKRFKSFKVFKNGKITGEIKGTLQPFTVSGSEELIRVGLDCGFGQNNSMGCGYVEVVRKTV